MRIGPLAFILFAAGAVGCSSVVGPGSEPVVGIIDIYEHAATPDVLQVPDTVAAGVEFSAVVVTYGSSTCTRVAGAEVVMAGMLAEITPYDRDLSDRVCTDDLRAFPREVRLRFDAPGEALVRVIGRSLFGGSAEVEQAVVVR